MKASRLLLGALTLCAVLFAVDHASAQSPYSFLLGNGGFGLRAINRVNQPRIPYFAQYPPVYYSEPVARPYGFSPYAALPGQIPAELRFLQQPGATVRPAPTPQMIENPFIGEIEPLPPADVTPTSLRKQAAAGAGELKLAPTQALVENPYVKDSASANRIASRATLEK